MEKAREGSKISSQTPNEPLVPEPGRLPNFSLPELRGYVTGAVLIALALAAGVLMPAYLDAPFIERAEAGVWGSGPYFALISTVVIGALPQLVALVFLWSGLMTISAPIVAQVLDLFVAIPMHRFVPTYSGLEFADFPLVGGTIAYSCVFLIFRRSNPVLPFGAALLVVALYALSFVSWSASWLTLFCSLVISLGIWAIGVALAEHVGFDVYGTIEQALDAA